MRPCRPDARSSDPLEVTRQLPVGDDLVEGPLLEPRGVQVVLDHPFAKRRPRHLRALQLGDRLAERLGHLGKRRVFVRVALVELGRLEPARDAVEPGGDRGREGQIRIGVGARDTILHAEASPFTAEPEATRPVVPAGHDPRGRKRSGLIALVGVHAGRVEVRELARHRELARQPVAEERRTGSPRSLAASSQQRLAPSLVPERRMQVKRRAGRRHVVLGHERDGRAVLVSDLLGAVLVERGAVCHLERLGVTKVDFLLAAAPLALRGLNRNVRGFHAVADRADERLLLRGLKDVIVLQVTRHRRQIVVALAPCLLERLLEAVELELGGSLHDVAQRRGALDLPLENPPRRLLDRLALLGVDIAEDQGGLRQPRDEPQGREIGDHLHVAVPALPRGELEAGQGLHLHVDGEEIDASVGAVVHDVIEEIAADNALAHEPAERVGEHRQHRVDFALLDELLELLLADPAGHGADSSVPPGPVSSCRPCRRRSARSSRGRCTTSPIPRSPRSPSRPSTPRTTRTSSSATRPGAATSCGVLPSPPPWSSAPSPRRCSAASPITPAPASASSSASPSSASRRPPSWRRCDRAWCYGAGSWRWWASSPTRRGSFTTTRTCRASPRPISWAGCRPPGSPSATPARSSRSWPPTRSRSSTHSGAASCRRPCSSRSRRCRRSSCCPPTSAIPCR